MGKIAIFIDGAYLSKVLQESFGSPQIDFSKLSSFLANGDQILRTYYYNCMPYKSLSPSQGEINRYNNMQRFVTALENLDHYTVRLGKLEFRGRDSHGNPIFQQKRVDILLGCDLGQYRTTATIRITGRPFCKNQLGRPCFCSQERTNSSCQAGSVSQNQIR